MSASQAPTVLTPDDIEQLLDARAAQLLSDGMPHADQARLWALHRIRHSYLHNFTPTELSLGRYDEVHRS